MTPRLPLQESGRGCPECGQTGRGSTCHHWDATGERKIPTSRMWVIRHYGPLVVRVYVYDHLWRMR